MWWLVCHRQRVWAPFTGGHCVVIDSNGIVCVVKTTFAGLVLTDRVKWVSFHSGYDFGYLLKVLTGGSPLPAEESEFFRLLHTFFPVIFDVKNMMVSCDSLKGGLNKLADDLDVRKSRQPLCVAIWRWCLLASRYDGVWR